MRVFIFILLALAIGKVGTQAYVRQDSAKNTIINAYRDHALAACRSYLGNAAGTPAVKPDPGSQAYRPDHDVKYSFDLMIGNPKVDVRLWQTSHSRWSARYRDPFILVRSQGANGAAVCEYDINHGTVYARSGDKAGTAG